jgi:hypothetical protein
MPYVDPSPVEEVSPELADELMARHVEVQTLADLMGKDQQRSTPIPALYNMWFSFVQNPSTVSVETFKRMIDTDETLGSGVDFLTSCLVARMGAYQHDDPEITRFMTRALDDMAGGFTEVCKEMLSACWAGFSVSEIVWANKAIGFVPERLATLPPTTVLFEVDRTGEVKDDGVLQYQKNFTPANTAYGSGFGAGLASGIAANGFTPRPDPLAKFGDMQFPVRTGNMFNYMAVRVPKLKCVHFAWNGPGRFGNPYGRALLRRAYNWWVQKWAYVQMMGTALDRKGTPLNVIFADQSATIVKDVNKAGSSERKGRGDTINAAVAAALAFKNVHNDSTIVLPGKRGQIFDIETIAQDANVESFVNVLQFCNMMQMRALLIPALVFTSGDGAGSYALGQEHAKTFDKLLDGYLEGFKRTLLDQLVRQIIAYNFPRDTWQKVGLGSFAKRELTIDEREKEVQMFGVAIDKGIVDTQDLADLNKMREALGFEPRTQPIPKPAAPDPFGLFGGNPDGIPPGEDGADPEGDDGTEGAPADGDEGKPTAAGGGVRPIRGQPAGNPFGQPAGGPDAAQAEPR